MKNITIWITYHKELDLEKIVNNFWQSKRDRIEAYYFMHWYDKYNIKIIYLWDKMKNTIRCDQVVSYKDKKFD